MPRDVRKQARATPLPQLAAEVESWLIREARFLPSNREVIEEFCALALAGGIPIGRVSLHQRAFHPQYRGAARIWRIGEPVEELFFDHGIEKTAAYLKNPIRLVIEQHVQVDWRLDGNEKLPFPMLDDLRGQGFTHYALAPVPYSVGTVNAFSWATKRPGGFTAEEMGFFHHILPAYAAVAELKALKRFIGGILTTYVGDEAGKFILDGQVRRGDVREITAALMLVDLRDFSMLSDRLEPRAVIRILNRYFDCVMPPMRKHGGEVVEIMGDGVLAIFREEPGRNPAQACEAAMMAATAGLDALRARNRRRPDTPALSAGAALHYGTVSYGNIGSGNRLDFTVIGSDVNLTSRIERLCRELDRTLIMSEAFADMLGRPMPEIGQFELRGFSRMQRLFGLPGR